MHTTRYKVRPGFSVILNANSANDPKARVYGSGEEVELTEAQVIAHQHKLESTDSAGHDVLARLSGQIQAPAQDIHQRESDFPPPKQ
jgi:hypothetical protein